LFGHAQLIHYGAIAPRELEPTALLGYWPVLKVATDLWPVFKWPRVAAFGWPSRLNSARGTESVPQRCHAEQTPSPYSEDALAQALIAADHDGLIRIERVRGPHPGPGRTRLGSRRRPS
jgi:hypothetical protein